MKKDTTTEVTVRLKKHPRDTALSTPAVFQIEVPADLLGEFGLSSPGTSSRVIQCLRAA